MKYPTLALCAFMLKTEWSTTTHSSAFVYAKDKDSRPTSHRETNTSPTADSGISSSIIEDAKKNGIRANTMVVAEPSIESEEGISSTVDEGILSSTIIHDAYDEKQDDIFGMAKVPALQAALFVDCVNGYDDTNTSLSCAEACKNNGLSCCEGAIYGKDAYYYAACPNFNGRLYNNSCNGPGACVNASIQTVKNGCIGDKSCYEAGLVGNMIDSCNGYRACWGMDTHADITRSCNGFGACNEQGVTGNMIDSCNGMVACHDGQDSEHADITRSCNYDFACYGQGVTGNMTDSCNGLDACWEMASHEDITGSCNAPFACYYQGVVTTDMLNCCNTREECRTIPLPANCTATATKVSLPK